MSRIGIAALAAALVAALATALSTAPGARASGSSNLFADVSANGALLAGNGVASVTHLGAGRFEVTFTSNVGACAYLATTVNAFSQALQVFTAGGHLSANGVYVETKNQGGGLTDGPFDLVVECGASNPYAVVGYDGTLARGGGGASVRHLGVGRYDVSFTAAVGKCAYIATVGDPASALVFNPSGVSTGKGPDANTVYVETKNPGGGLTDGIPFHLAAICSGVAGTSEAVVQAGGLPARASSLTSAYRASTGSYVLVTGAPLGACAVVATRGSVNKAVPFDPATVETTAGPGANTVGIQVRQLLFFGGALADEAFHAAAIC